MMTHTIGINNKNLSSGLGFFAVIAIAGFAILRFKSGNQFMGVFDSVLSLGFLAMSCYVYVTGRLEMTRYVGAVIAVVGTLMTLKFNSPPGVYWVYVTTVALFILLPYRHAIAFSAVTILGASLLLWNDSSYTQLSSFFVTISLISIFSFLFALNTERIRRELQILSVQDDLTGLGNRRAFTGKISEALNIYKRFGLPYSLIYLDIDHFKSINDSLGHIAGDRILKDIAECLQTILRATDSLFRIGGDEFVIIVGGADQQAATLLAEKLRKNVECEEFVSDRTLTISLGLSEIEGDDTTDSWIARADNALYQAKKTGRNRVERDTKLQSSDDLVSLSAPD